MSGRKTRLVTIPESWGGRDAGKMYLITEHPAAAAERWALRMFTLLQNSEERIPDNVRTLGMIGIAKLTINIWLRGSIDADVLIPLLDELLTCVQRVRDPNHPEIATKLFSDDDIEEVKTRLWLRSEVLRLHTGFSPADALSSLLSAASSETSTSTES